MAIEGLEKFSSIQRYPIGSVWVYTNAFDTKEDYHRHNRQHDFVTSRPVLIISRWTSLNDTVQVVPITRTSDRPGFDCFIPDSKIAGYAPRGRICPYDVTRVSVKYLTLCIGMIDPHLMQAVLDAYLYHINASDVVPPYIDEDAVLDNAILNPITYGSIGDQRNIANPKYEIAKLRKHGDRRVYTNDHDSNSEEYYVGVESGKASLEDHSKTLLQRLRATTSTEQQPPVSIPNSNTTSPTATESSFAPVLQTQDSGKDLPSNSTTHIPQENKSSKATNPITRLTTSSPGLLTMEEIKELAAKHEHIPASRGFSKETIDFINNHSSPEIKGALGVPTGSIYRWRSIAAAQLENDKTNPDMVTEEEINNFIKRVQRQETKLRFLHRRDITIMRHLPIERFKELGCSKELFRAYKTQYMNAKYDEDAQRTSIEA